MGNGAKAQQKRDRNSANKPAAGKSQLKTNNAALTLICNICRQAFLQTSREPALMEHVNAKHAGKDLKACFPTVAAAQ